MIQFEFTDRFEWQSVPNDYKPKKGEQVVEGIQGKVRRTSLGPGITTTSPSTTWKDVCRRWQDDRDEASKALLMEGQAPLPHKSDHLLLAEHLAAGIVAENAPGRIKKISVPSDKQLETFLKSYFGVK